MRVLLAASLGGVGHLEPVAAVGQVVQRLGHEAMVLVPPSMAPAAADTGLQHVVGKEPPRSVVDEIWDRVRAGPPEAVAGLIDRELFAERCTESMLGTARALCDSWQPDLVVRDPCEYASAIAAHEAGLAHVEVGISAAAIERGVLEMVTPILDRLGPGVAEAIAAAPYATSFPASLDPSPWPDTRRYRLTPRAPRALPDWWPGNDQPLVYITFGSVIGHLPEAAGVFRAALEAVSGLAARVLLTVGRAIDPGALGPVPGTARVEQWVAQTDVLGQAALVVCHGGSGTTFGALAAGLPLVICPLFADQSINGRTVETAGCGLVVPGRHLAVGELRGLGPADVAALRDAIDRVLGESAHRAAAQHIAAEIALMPGLDRLVEHLIEGVDRGRRNDISLHDL